MICVKCGKEFMEWYGSKICSNCYILGGLGTGSRECWDTEEIMIVWTDDSKDLGLHRRDLFSIKPIRDCIFGATRIFDWIDLINESKRPNKNLYIPSQIRENKGIYKQKVIGDHSGKE